MIIVSPWSKRLENNRPHPKCPTENWWRRLVSLIDERVIQVGIPGEVHVVEPENVRHGLSLKELGNLIDECRTWVSVDSFFQHFAWDRGKYGVVVFGQSNPRIFGHPENVNLLKDEGFLMPDQFLFWHLVPYREDAFVEPEEAVRHVWVR